tara:strand:- start:602 stop:4348 length:3747 start_codon:yes stop_codon:yes gene_type:complete
MTFTILNPGPFGGAINTPQVQNNPNITVAPTTSPPATSPATSPPATSAPTNTVPQNQIPAENFYPTSTEIKETTLDNRDTSYPLAYVRFKKDAKFPVTLSNGITIEVPLEATNTTPVPPGAAPVQPQFNNYVVTAYIPNDQQIKDARVQYAEEGRPIPGNHRAIGYAYPDGRYVTPQGPSDRAREVGNLLIKRAGEIKKKFDADNEVYSVSKNIYDEKLTNYQNDLKIQKGVNALAKAAAQATLDKSQNEYSGDYTKNRDKLLEELQREGISDPRGLENAFREFYVSADLTPPELSEELYQETPYERLGDARDKFDSQYYENQEALINLEYGPKQQWEKIVKTDDVDMLHLYGVDTTTRRAETPFETYLPDNFYRNDYRIRTQNGEQVRGNSPYEILAYGAKDEEGNFIKPEQLVDKGVDFVTDSDLQNVRNIQLGVGRDDEDALIRELLEQEGEVFNRLREEYQLAMGGESEEWKNLQNQYTWEDGIPLFELNQEKPLHFLNLLRISASDALNDPDNETAKRHAKILEDIRNEDENYDAELRITDAEDVINSFVSDESKKEIRKFGALTEDALKRTLSEIEKQRAEEANLAFLKGFGSFDEVFNAASTITDSLLNDTGIGGLLPLTSSNASKYRADLEKNVKDLVGVNNSVEYNWENWFENNLSRNYNTQYYLDNIEKFEPLEKGQDILEAYKKTQHRYPLFDMYETEEVEVENPETGEITIEQVDKYNQDFLNEAGFSSSQELNDFLNTETEESAYLNEIKNIIQHVSNETISKADNNKELEELLQTHKDDIDELDRILQEETGEEAFVVTINDEEQAINGRFLRSFLNDYLKPRFNTSRSMDEFVEYMDVRQKEKNPFQTEDFASAIRDAGRAASEEYLKDVLQPLEGQQRSFDYEYYMNPIETIKERGTSTIDTENPPEKYINQAEIINRDWEIAKNNPDSLVNANAPEGTPNYGTWAQQAYRYGYDLNNAEDFAKLHFDLLGYKTGDGNYNFDPAEDYFNATSIQDFLDGKLVQVLTDRATQVNSVFGRFITPEEFADEFLIGLDPANAEEYEKALKEVGLEGFKGTLDELKEYIVQNIRTGTAQAIREQIKYLNERRKEPTQEVLGITYIQRPEDFKETGGVADTQLYKFFQDAGYQGSESEFFETFAPDQNREDLELIATISDPKGFKFAFDSEEMSDPFTALGTFNTFLEDFDEEEDSSETREREEGFFDIFGSYDEEEDMSDTAKGFLAEFTSFIKPNV